MHGNAPPREGRIRSWGAIPGAIDCGSGGPPAAPRQRPFWLRPDIDGLPAVPYAPPGEPNGRRNGPPRANAGTMSKNAATTNFTMHSSLSYTPEIGFGYEGAKSAGTGSPRRSRE